MLAIICLIAIIPALGFISWLIAIPVLLITLILGIIVLSKGATMQGIMILLVTLILAPVFLFVVPILTTGGAILAGAAAEKTKNSETSGGILHEASSAGVSEANQSRMDELNKEITVLNRNIIRQENERDQLEAKQRAEVSAGLRTFDSEIKANKTVRLAEFSKMENEELSEAKKRLNKDENYSKFISRMDKKKEFAELVASYYQPIEIKFKAERAKLDEDARTLYNQKEVSLEDEFRKMNPGLGELHSGITKSKEAKDSATSELEKLSGTH